MKVVTSRINYFTPIDNNGVVQGTYYLDQCGNVVRINGKPQQVYLPYVTSIDVHNIDDICTLHISEIEQMITKLKSNVQNINDHDKRIKYEGYIEALNYVVTHNSYIDPWNDYLKEHFE